jgi:transglutaminase-like putative cysteine protease
MRVLPRLVLVVLGGLVLMGAEPKTRSFRCTYEAVVTGLPAGKAARIWLPVPSSNGEQEVALVKRELPGEGTIGTEKKYHNEVLYIEGRAGADGTIPLALHYRVKRREVRAGGQAEAEAAEDLSRFLAADAKVPVGGKPASLLEGRTLPDDSLQLGRALFDLVNEHMRYSKEGTGWGQGDAVWACDSRYGNCTDFHSLFISLARTRKLPSKFVIGFLLPPKRGSGTVAGYHCWAYFRPKSSGWVPVDISEANKDPKHKDDYFGRLSEDRVAFSVGRDLVLVPPQDGPPLNFFLHPYVEVDKKPYPAAKVKLHFRYEDIAAKK